MRLFVVVYMTWLFFFCLFVLWEWIASCWSVISFGSRNEFFQLYVIIRNAQLELGGVCDIDSLSRNTMGLYSEFISQGRHDMMLRPDSSAYGNVFTNLKHCSISIGHWDIHWVCTCRSSRCTPQRIFQHVKVSILKVNLLNYTSILQSTLYLHKFDA